MPPGPHKKPMRAYLSLAVFIALELAAGALAGFVHQPGGAYASLAKPGLSPPDWIFVPPWALLYVLIAIAGWRTWQRAPRSGAMAAWFLQLALYAVWPPLLFGEHRIGDALIVVAVLLATIFVFMASSWRRDRIAALLLVPYAAWAAFATLVNGAVWSAD